jgi:predicted nucleic acid-binding protein
VKLIDSSGWIEFFTDGPLAEEYAAYLSDLPRIVTPTVVLYEVYKKIERERTEAEALLAAAQMHKTQLVPFTDSLALTAADLSLQHGLSMADAMVYATALLLNVELVTSDADLAQLPGVKYLAKRTTKSTGSTGSHES